MTNIELFNLPAGPPELCFDTNEFAKQSFSVDSFLHKHRNAASLESMRDDLGLYLKVLRSSMIELINEDYVDFVNLSSNLIGLDHSINGIQVPLGQLKEEILMVKMTLTDTMDELSFCLNEKMQLRQHLRSVQSLAKVRKSIAKLDTLLSSRLSGNNEMSAIDLERAALVYIQLQFDIQFCGGLMESSESGEEKIQSLHNVLMKKIEKYFLNTLANTSLDNLERCLRIYCTLNECAAAELIFRKHIVFPYIDPIISETTLQNCPQGLHGIYNQILEFITTKMTNLLSLTASRNGPDAKVKGFDFLVNSFWSEVERLLETHMTSIFAPGNPNAFYQKYKHTNEFLSRLENAVGHEEGVKKLRSHSQYRSFQTKWNLPVYFQIRFQEIGGNLEAACSKPINKNLIQVNEGFKIQPFQILWQCIEKCWSEGIYLPQIFISFWKLTLQSLARIVNWTDECLAISDFPENNEKLMKIDFFIYLFLDIETILRKFPELIGIVMKNVPDALQSHENLLNKCLNETKHEFVKSIETIQNAILKEMLTVSFPFIKQVNDIPRLYRKTNKDVPSKPCSYVDQMLEATRQFYQKYSKQIEHETIVQILSKVFSNINVQYFVAVDDVLTSVQKTEESLRRLKNLRDKGAAAQPVERLGMSDDDKIRLQLQVDIIHWTTEIERFGVGRNQVDRLNELISLVEESTKIKVSK